MKKSNNLAVVLLNYNDANTVINHANVIKKYSYIDKIIIVDNASEDNSYKNLKKIQSDKIDVIKTPYNGGYAYGNNYGIKYLIEKYGEFNYIAVSNSDIEISEDAYKKCVSFLDKHNDVALCGPRMYDLDKHITYYCAWKYRTVFSDIIWRSYFLSKLFKRFNICGYSEEYLDSNDFVYVDCLIGAFFVIKGSAFKEVNYFDENTFLFVEEDILSKKLRSKGYKVVLLNNCNYIHYESTTIKKNLNYKKKRKIVYKSIKYYHTHYDEKCNKFYNKWKILFLDLFNILEPIFNLFYKIHHFNVYLIGVIRLFINKYFITRFIFNLITYIWKILVLLIQIVLLPITYIIKCIRKNKRILYISKKPYDVNKNILKDYLNKNNYLVKSIYFYDDLDMLYNFNCYKNKNKIKNIKIKKYNFENRLRFYMILKTSFWLYDEIIIENIEMNYYFFMLINHLKGTKITFENVK